MSAATVGLGCDCCRDGLTGERAANRFMANRMLEILRENEILYEDGKRDDKGHLGGMLGAG